MTFQFLTRTLELAKIKAADGRFQAPQLDHNMTTSERDLLCTWAKLLREVKYCEQLESCDELETVPKVRIMETLFQEHKSSYTWGGKCSRE